MEKWMEANIEVVQAWDGVTGKELDGKTVWEARQTEIAFFRNMMGLQKAKEVLGLGKGREDNRDIHK